MARTPVTQWRRKDKKDQFCSLLLHILQLYICVALLLCRMTSHLSLEDFSRYFEKEKKIIWYGSNSYSWKTLEVRRKENTDWSSEKWIAKRSFAIYIFDLVKLCSKKRKDTAKIDCLNIVPIHPAFFQTHFYSCQMTISLNQTSWIV